MVKIKEILCRSILSPSKLPGCDYVINPYVGCVHNCAWCYARFMKNYTGHDNDEWGSFVDVKINAPEVLIKGIRKLKDSPTIFFSSVCDCYQPLEAKYKLTRKCLEILSSFPFPTSILTQSKLVLRDIDLFKKFKDIEVGMSFITMDEKATRVFQPAAALPRERMVVLKKLHQTGLKTYLHVGPILPLFTDFEAIFKAVFPWVDSVMGETLNTRGENWTSLIKVLSYNYPGLLSEFKKNKFQDPNYLHQIKSDFKKAAQKYKIRVSGVYTHGQN
jgi:DNA repair photolyase